RMEGIVKNGQSLTVMANSLDNANTSSFGFSMGVASVNVATADAEAFPAVNAIIDGNVTVAGQDAVQAIDNKNATAETRGLSIGGIAIGGMIATAKTGNSTAAQMNGLIHAGSVQVMANGPETASAHAFAGGAGGLAIQGAQATSDASGTVEASI